MARQISQTLIALALTAASLSTAAGADQADPKQSGPVALVIQYKCLPAQRAQFRQRLASLGLAQFARWHSEGILGEYHILFSRYVDSNAWDALALLTFPSYAEVVRWRKVEQMTPAGLGPDLIGLASNIETYPVDLMRQASSEDNPQQPVYMVIPYTYNVSPADYLKYVDTYVSPQFNGWMKEGVLAGYRLYLQRYGAARPWDTLIFLQYKDDESFGQRERVVAKVRAQLLNDPLWKAASENKQNLRVEKEAIIADELSPHR